MSREDDEDGDDQPSGIDPALDERVLDAMSIWREAHDAAVANPTDATLEELQKATDDLMRALARLLLELGVQRSSPPPDR